VLTTLVDVASAYRALRLMQLYKGACAPFCHRQRRWREGDPGPCHVPLLDYPSHIPPLAPRGNVHLGTPGWSDRV